MPYRKMNRGLRRFQRKFKRRYRAKKATAGAVAKLYKRVNAIQKNQEVKFLTTKINTGGNYISQGVPFLQALDLPPQGTQTGERVGSKVQFVNHSMKLRFIKQNFGDATGSISYKAYIIWLKDAINVQTTPFAVSNILLTDYNNGYTPLSYFNNRAYPNWLATHKTQGTIVDYTPVTTWAGTPAEPNNNTVLGRASQNVNRYHTVSKKINITSEWQTEESGQSPPANQYLARMKPYLMVICDALGTGPPSTLPPFNTPSGYNNDTFTVRGEIRLSYKDM